MIGKHLALLELSGTQLAGNADTELFSVWTMDEHGAGNFPFSKEKTENCLSKRKEV